MPPLPARARVESLIAPRKSIKSSPNPVRPPGLRAVFLRITFSQISISFIYGLMIIFLSLINV